ncbi:MAG: hypothetical protein ACR2LC_12525 [Pyrinomonadaceae bacterium]
MRHPEGIFFILLGLPLTVFHKYLARMARELGMAFLGEKFLAYQLLIGGIVFTILGALMLLGVIGK